MKSWRFVLFGGFALAILVLAPVIQTCAIDMLLPHRGLGLAAGQADKPFYQFVLTAMGFLVAVGAFFGFRSVREIQEKGEEELAKIRETFDRLGAELNAQAGDRFADWERRFTTIELRTQPTPPPPGAPPSPPPLPDLRAPLPVGPQPRIGIQVDPTWGFALLQLPGHRETPEQTEARRLFGEGMQLQRHGKVADAMDRWTQSVRTSPSPEAYGALGIALLSRGDLAKATTALCRSIELSPENAQVHAHLGIALARQGRLDEAIRSFWRATRLRPGYAEAYYNLGLAFEKKERPRAAESAYRKAIRFRPDFIDARHNLAVLHTAMGKFRESADMWRDILTRKTDSLDAYNGLAIALARSGEHLEAIAAWESALRVKPDDPRIHNNLGLAYLHVKDTDRALGKFREALRHDPTYFDAKRGLGRALAQKEDWSGAISAYSDALESWPNHAEILYDLACAQARAGDLNGAVEHLRRAVELDARLRDVALKDPELEAVRQDPRVSSVLQT